MPNNDKTAIYNNLQIKGGKTPKPDWPENKFLMNEKEGTAKK